MFHKALRAGLPISQEALGKNLQDCGLPPQIGDHKLDLEVERRFLAKERSCSPIDDEGRSVTRQIV